jgi:hypothetical protein
MEFDFSFTYPATTEPAWKDQVDRWYQLDAPAYGLAEFYQQNKDKLGPPPGLIILASPSASNSTDFQFVNSGARSPAKFVHTLPNIRISPLAQVMNWHGPLLCFQKGEQTLSSAREEATYLLSDLCPIIWLLSVNEHQITAIVMKK